MAVIRKISTKVPKLIISSIILLFLFHLNFVKPAAAAVVGLLVSSPKQCQGGQPVITFTWQMHENDFNGNGNSIDDIQELWIDIAIDQNHWASANRGTFWWGIPVISGGSQVGGNIGDWPVVNIDWVDANLPFDLSQGDTMYWRVNTHYFVDSDTAGGDPDDGRVWHPVPDTDFNTNGGQPVPIPVCPAPNLNLTSTVICDAGITKIRYEFTISDGQTTFLFISQNSDLSQPRTETGPYTSNGSFTFTPNATGTWYAQLNRFALVGNKTSDNITNLSCSGPTPTPTTTGTPTPTPYVSPPSLVGGKPPAELCTLNEYFASIVQILTLVGGFAFFAMLITGGYRYLTSGGDPKGTAAARNIITFAVIGIVLMIVAWLILIFVQQLTGARPNLRFFDICPPFTSA